jgi:hypothetical protein
VCAEVDARLAFFDSAFKVPKQNSQATPATKRRVLIESTSRIAVSVSAPEMAIKNGQGTVRFRQKYVSVHFVSDE